MNEQIIELDISKDGMGDCLNVGQDDNRGITIAAHIFDNGAEMSLTGATVRLMARLPDRRHYFRDECQSVSGNVAKYTADESKLCAVAGYTDEAYFSIELGGKTYSTNRFALNIMRSVLTDSTGASSWDPEINAIMDKAQQAIDSVSAAKDSATDAAAKATAAAKTATDAAATASTATSAANSAASSATSAASSANTAAGKADGAATAATSAAKTATDAATSATSAAGSATSAASSANAAASTASKAASDANSASAAATGAATSATNAATSATEAAASATSAAARAEAAAEAASQTAKLYGSRFTGSAAVGTRLYDSVGREATPSTATVAGSSDFDDCGPFHVDFVKRAPDDSGKWRDVAFEGTPSWDSAGAISEFCRFRNIYFLMTDDGTTDTRVISTSPFAGASALFVNEDGSVPEFIYIPRYLTSKDENGASQSVPGRYPAWGGYSAFAASDKLAGATCYSGSTWYETWKLLVPVIEYNNRNVQAAIGDGFSGGELTNAADKLVENMENGNTVKVAPARAALFVVGQGAFVGKNTWDSATSPNIKADDRTITAVNSETGEITLDGEPFSATTDDMLSNLDWKTGSTDSVLGHTGQPVRSNKYPVKYRGIEGIWGGANETIIDIRLKTATKEDGTKYYETYFCNDLLKARDCTANAPNADFVNVGLPWPTTAGYVRQSQASEAYPALIVPANTTGASSTTYYCDYYYLDASMPDDRAPRSGINWTYGGGLGAFCRYAYSVASSSNRYCCARLFTEP